MLQCLAETDAGVEDNFLSGNTGRLRNPRPLQEKLADLFDNIVIGWILLHVPWGTLHVHQNQWRSGLANGLGHLGIKT